MRKLLIAAPFVATACVWLGCTVWRVERGSGVPVHEHLSAVHRSHFCTPDVSDHSAWKRRKQGKIYRVPSHAIFQPPEPVSPQYWCDKISNEIEPWKRPVLRPEDLAVGLFSGESLLYSRASTCADTWLSWLPSHRIYAKSAEPLAEPTLPLTSLSHESLFANRTEYGGEATRAHLLQLYGLRDLVRRYPESKWFFIGGDDTMLHPGYALRMLSQYNHSEPLWLAVDTWKSETLGKSKLAKRISGEAKDELGREGVPIVDVQSLQRWYPSWHKAHGGGGRFHWAPGSSSWFLSAPAARMWADELGLFLSRVDVERLCCCPDLTTGLLLCLLGLSITHLPAMGRAKGDEWGVHRYAADSRDVDWSATPRVVLYHYLHPRRMLSAGQRWQHGALDSIAAADDGRSLREFAAAAVRSHRQSLRRRRTQAEQLARRAGPQRDSDPAVWAQWEAEVLAAADAAERLRGDRRVAALRELIDSSFALMRRRQSQVAMLTKRAGLSLNTRHINGYDIPQWTG